MKRKNEFKEDYKTVLSSNHPIKIKKMMLESILYELKRITHSQLPENMEV